MDKEQVDRYYLPLSEKDTFILELKDPTLKRFADFLTFADTRKEVYITRESAVHLLAVFEVRAGIFRFRYSINEKAGFGDPPFMYAGAMEERKAHDA